MVTLVEPLRDVHIRHLRWTACPASFAIVTVDFEPPSEPGTGVELIDRLAPDDRIPTELFDALRDGLRQELADAEGAPLLDTRVVLHHAVVHLTDSHARDFEHAGRLAARELLRSLPDSLPDE